MAGNFREKGFRFFFYSNEGNEPIHYHVEKGEGIGKIWLEPALSIDYLRGFTKAEEKDIIKITEANIELFKQKWHEHFSQ